MIYYVSHKYGGDTTNIEKARRITHDLQIRYPDNLFLCPLNALDHLAYGEIGYKEELGLCLKLLAVCDALIVSSEISNGVSKEIDFAEANGKEVIYLAERHIGL